MKRTIIKKEKPKTKDLLTSYRGKKLKTFQKVYKNTTDSEKKTFLGFLLNDNSKNREGFINYLLDTEKLPLKEQIILILKSKNYLLLQSFINDQNKQQILEMVCLYSQFFDFEILTILAKNKVNFNHYFVNHQTFQSTDLLFSLLRYQFDQDLLQKSVFFLLKNYNFYLNHQYDYWPAPNFQTHSTKLNLLTLAFIKNQEKVFDYLLFLQANPFDQDCSTFKYVSRNISFSKKDYLLKLIDHQLIFENFHLIEDLLKENLPLTSQQILQSFYERSQIHQQIKNSINCSDTLVLQKI